MIAKEASTRAEIQQAARAIREQRPAYADIVEYYEQLFLAQEDVKTQIRPDLLQVDSNRLVLKRQEHFPVLPIADFKIDHQTAETLLQRLCRLTSQAKSEMAVTAQALRTAMQSGLLDANRLFSALLDGDDAVFMHVADDLAIDKQALSFLIYSAIKPSLARCADQVAAHLGDALWEKGYCPVCGSQPGIAFLGSEGDRWLSCGFCWHKWPVTRIFCPFCENKDSQTLHYFYSETENGYRVDVCDSCRRYIKTVDTRVIAYPIYPPLEQISTLHLDILAREKGLEGGA